MKPRRSLRIVSLTALVTALSVFAASPAFAVGGTLNSNFGNGTGYITGPSSVTDTVINDIAVNSDGSIIAVGYRNNQPTVFKFTATGAPDLSFNASGTAGYFSSILGSGFSSGEFDSVAIGAGGTIYVTGYGDTGSTQVAVVLNLNANGTANTSFGQQGVYFKAQESPGGAEFGSSIAVAPSGKIYFGGSFLGNITQNGFLVALTASGQLDTSFDTDGKITVSLYPVTAVAINPAGKIIASIREVFSTSFRQFTSSGTMDPNFGTNGESIVVGATNVDDIHIDVDGIVFTGDYENSQQSLFGLLGRLTSAGNVDSNFAASTASPGLVLSSDLDSISSVTRQANGNYIVAGFFDLGATSQPRVAAYTSSGVLDTSFNSAGSIPGIFQFSAFPSTWAQAQSVAMAPNNVIVAAGWNTVSFGFPQYFVVSLSGAGTAIPSLPETGMNSSTFFLASGVAVATVLVGVLLVMRKRKESTRK